MSTRGLALTLMAFTTAAVLASACSSKKTGPAPTPTPEGFTLTNGGFNLTGVSDTNGNTCYSATGANSSGLAVIDDVGAAGAFSMSVQGTAFTLGPPSLAQGFLPSWVGTVVGGSITGVTTSQASLSLTATCTLFVGSTIDGHLIADNTLATVITLNLSVPQPAGSNSNGCVSFANSGGDPVILGAIPFPTLTQANAGSPFTCTIPVSGTLTGPQPVP